MGVPGLRLCSDIVADGVDELHPDRTAAPWRCARVPWVCGVGWAKWCVRACVGCVGACDMLLLLLLLLCEV